MEEHPCSRGSCEGGGESWNDNFRLYSILFGFTNFERFTCARIIKEENRGIYMPF